MIMNLNHVKYIYESSNHPEFRAFHLFLWCLIIVSGWYAGINEDSIAANVSFTDDRYMQVGVATVDITPSEPIRLSGYITREQESEGVLQRLEAKALAFGSDDQGPSLFITVDLIGVPGHITVELRNRLSERANINASQVIISSSHTHTGPEIGHTLNIYGERLPADQLGRIIKYSKNLIQKLEEVAMMALEKRRPSLVSWGQGTATFAVNRRVIEDGRWVAFGVNPDGPVDHSLPLLQITDLEGNITALLVNYACHGTTLGPEINKFHNDWMGETKRIIEQRHPGSTVLVSIGAGADANPEPRLDLEHTIQHGKEIADEVDRILTTSLQPITTPPVGAYKEIELPFADVPTIDELVEQANADWGEGYYAKAALERIARGESLPESLIYPIQTWTFGDDLSMVFLAGEVVADYSLRLKEEIRNQHLWVTAYANDVPGYIASSRVIKEGGYEVDLSMYYYNQPSRFAEEIEDMIIQTVHELLKLKE